jgi:hypothetical protein
LAGSAADANTEALVEVSEAGGVLELLARNEFAS